MLFGASLDIASVFLVLQTGQVTVQTPTTPFQAGFDLLGMAKIRPADPTSATKPKVKLPILIN
jgi:hypothetical protein